MRKYYEYIFELRAKGKRTFTFQSMCNELDLSIDAAKKACSRLSKEKMVVSPLKGFYIIIDPKDRNVGALEPKESIPLIMAHLKRDYYVCLLSAAQFYGAAHQHPMVFQVMVEKRLKPIKMGRIRIDFVYKKNLSDLPVLDFQVDTGLLKVSSPELTAMDLFLYPSKVFSLNNVSTVLSELIEEIDVGKLISLCKSSTKKFWVQKLGYILDKIDPLDTNKRDKIVRALKDYVKNTNLRYLPLSSGNPTKGCIYNTTWKIIENTEIEADI